MSGRKGREQLADHGVRPLVGVRAMMPGRKGLEQFCAGALTTVAVPPPAGEAARDLARARDEVCDQALYEARVARYRTP